jgi:hypothetical protein
LALRSDDGKQPDAGAAGKKQTSKVTGFNGLFAAIYNFWVFCNRSP